MRIFDSIENDNFEEVKRLVESGINIYKPRNFPFDLAIELPLTHTIAFCKSEKIANYFLDIYERDLEVLKGTNYKKALVATPEDQSEELLSCCSFSIPSDEKFFEPVLLKKNNLEPPRLAFLCRKLKDKNDQSLKFIRKLERNGSCDLSDKINNCLYAYKFSTATRLYTSQFVSDDEKLSLGDEFLDRFFFNGDISSHKHLYKDYKFNQRHIVFCAFRKNLPLLEYVLKHKMDAENCSMNDILNLDFNDIYCDVHNNQSKVLYEIILNGLHEDLNLEIDEEMFFSKNDTATNAFFKSWFKSTCKNDEIIKRFFEKHPNLLTLKSHENLTVLEYAVRCGNPDIIKIIYEMDSDRDIFIRDEDRTLKCLKVSNLFEAKIEKITEILKLLLRDTFESFVLKYGSDVIKSHTDLMKVHGAAYFYSLSFFKDTHTDKFSIFDITSLHLYNECEPFKKLVEYFDILDWNIADANDETLFMKACNLFRFDPEFLKLIIAKQPDCVHKRTKNNSTCLHFVAFHENDEIARLLVEMGVDPQVTNNDGMKAINFVYSDTVFSYLLQFESDEDCHTLIGNIHKPEHMRLLLSRNIDVLARNSEGILSKLCVIPGGAVAAIVCMNYIQEKKIDEDINLRDNDGNNILMRSIMPPHYYPLFGHIVKIYKNKLDFKATNNSGQNFVDLMKNIYINFLDYLQVVKEECVAEFTENFHSFENFTTLELQPEYLLHVIELIKPSILIDKIATFIDDEKVFWRILTKHPTVTDFLLENSSALFKLIKVCNNEKSIGILIAKLSPEVFIKVNGDENVLHVICEKNNQRMIEDFLLILTINQIENLSKQTCGGKKPFDLLNEDLKLLFENVLKN